jgi:glucose-6-phosphate-specific signal transduction histidine kinase
MSTNTIMKKIMTIAIVILGIACATLITRNVMLHRELNENKAKTAALIAATEDVFEEIENYIDDKYGENISDTIWEGDVYDNWYTAFEAIVCF